VADMAQLDLADECPSAEQLVSRQQDDIAFMDSLRHLPELTRQVLMLRVVDDLRVAEIAAKLNITERSVRCRLTKAYSATRKRLNGAVSAGEKRD